MKTRIPVLLLVFMAVLPAAEPASGKDALGSLRYEDFEKPKACKSCHTRIYQQWQQAMMSQAYTHHWDEIEYWDLAVPHAEKHPELKATVDGCNGCHAPLAYLAGDVPPPRPEENSRANESVSCDLCHSITAVDGQPVNFNWVSEPGRTKYGAKEGLESPHHITKFNDIYTVSEYCGSCHNEQNDFGIWVKSTQIEWEEGPYAEQGVPCFVCHMPKAPGRSAPMAEEGMVAQHVFLGAHNEAKLKSAIEVSIHPDEKVIPYDGTVTFQVELFNAKAGHKVPTGSVEDRIMWLDVRAVDANGKEYHLPVDKKGFEGEAYTIAADALAYRDMGIPLGREGFEGVQRDGVPAGNRIFRMPYFDEDGIMTIMQWNTHSLGVDYRIGPRETKLEHFTWEMPYDVAFGDVTVTARLNYQKLVKPVADFLEVPEDESEVILINEASTTIEVYD